MEMYFDANVFIYYCNYPENSELHKTAKTYIEGIKNNLFTGITGYFTWDEVIWGIHKDKINPRPLRDAVKLADCFFKILNIIYLELDLSILQKARDIINKYGSDPRDALHASLAIEHSKGFVISNDHHMDDIGGVSRRFYL